MELCIIGNAKSQSDNPITHYYSAFFITFIVNADDGKILDAEVSMMLELTRSFTRQFFLGRSLVEVDQDLLEEIERRYLGSSQRAMQVAYKDAVKKYGAWRKGVSAAELAE